METSSTALPDKELLEREQLSLTNERIRVETRKIERDAVPERWWSKLLKNLLAFGGVVTIAGSLYGIIDSYNKTIEDREKTRVSDQRSRFEDAIKRLESPSTISKLVGVSILSGYLNPANKQLHHQILFTLAGLMATEKDFQTQAAVIDLMSSTKVASINDTEWHYFQDMLVTQSRALMTKGDLLNHRHFAAASPLSDEEQAARTVGRLIALNVRKRAVPGYKDYQGIYCEECDFRQVVFPDAMDFTGAVLDNTDFSGATMKSAIFNNAEIVGTKFVETDLRDAQFRSLAQSTLDPVVNDRIPPGRTAYIDHVASALDSNAIVKIVMPNFSCANLEGAHFERHALFPGVMYLKRTYARGDQTKVGWYQSVPEYLKERLRTKMKVEFNPIRVTPPKFFKAKVGNAKLEDGRFFDFIGVNDDFPNITDGNGIRIVDIASFQGRMTDHDFKFKSESNKKDSLHDKSNRDNDRNEELTRDILSFQRRLLGAFYSVNLDEASLPENLMAFLKQKEPTLADYRGAFHDPLGFSTADDPDLKCDRKYN